MYNYCTATQHHTNTRPAGRAVNGNNRASSMADGANIVGGELYARLKNHLKNYLEKICEVRKFKNVKLLPFEIDHKLIVFYFSHEF